ncbi:pilus assembly protein [Actinobacteria bacterium YIM 96077]|uniref:Pilus assembly protein n=1 Tax=Phytoactinopolyspora halophila TaxID=1981511 RepID=A0A329R2B4_9ACTN|nr:pilus assembly protein [Phytoactinopolyspora halophila]AYY12084.1 pilus assembly protein [Actinobacteria bacterium YIM 96077]RAW18681.1 pilus assembly protein [Phytoactinopolyspora halophila]
MTPARHRREHGNAIVEFHLLGLLLLVPIVYIMLATLDVQRSSFGVTQGVREAGRMFVSTGDEAAARHAATVALRDHGLDINEVTLSFSCSSTPCHQPGSEIRVTMNAEVALPFVPDVLAGSVNAHVPVEASHVAVVDRYRELP